MNYNILSFLFAWTFPTKKDRGVFRSLCNDIENRKLVKSIQCNYLKIQNKLKTKSNVRVLFLINEISKWKTQSLIEEMSKSDIFEPIIAVTIADIQKRLSTKEKSQILNESISYFNKKDIEVVCAYDPIKNKAISLDKFSPDIVFYQQPYNLPKIQDIPKVSKYALTCYVPYYLPDYRNFELDCGYSFHKNLFRFYVLNENLKEEYQIHLHSKNEFCENIKAVGHTTLDLYKKYQSVSNKEYVIYAPHWSIPHQNNENNINISTFMNNGEFILQYAKEHPEINWVFKPHPTLKTALRRIGEWSDAKIENYYSEWSKIAHCCYDSEYLQLFFESKALITDSGSFLLEYFFTGKPIIHLLSDESINKPYKFLKDIFNSFYKVYDLDELSNTLNELIIQNKDYKYEERNKLLKLNNMLDGNTSCNIINDLLSFMKGVK